MASWTHSRIVSNLPVGMIFSRRQKIQTLAIQKPEGDVTCGRTHHRIMCVFIPGAEEIRHFYGPCNMMRSGERGRHLAGGEMKKTVGEILRA